MRISSVQTHPYSLDFAKQLTTARSTIDGRNGIIVVAEADAGVIGLGDAAPIAGFNPESIEHVAEELAELKGALEGVEIPSDPAALSELLGTLQGRHSLSSSTIFAVESALADLASTQKGLPLSRWYNPHAAQNIEVNTLISGEAEALAERVEAALSFGFRTFKLKLAKDPMEAADNVRTVRATLPQHVKLRLDANQAYSFEQARKLLLDLEDLGIEYIEEPVREPTHEALMALTASSSVRIALDESLVNTDLLDECLADPVCGVFVLKPMSMGGILRTLSVASRAKAQGIETVVTTSLESAVGVTACIHTASALGEGSVAHGLMTESLYRHSFAQATLLATEGSVSVPSAAGLGRKFEFPEWD